MRRYTFAGLWIIGIVLLLLLSPSVKAAGEINLTPLKSTYKLQPGVKKQITFYLENKVDSEVVLTPFFNDFTSSTDSSGEPKILTDGTADSHGLSSWLTGRKTVTIDKNDKTSYTATISVPIDANDGSHYGIVRFLDAASASVGSIVIVDVGTITQMVAITRLAVGSGDTSGLVAADLKSTGNGITVPKVSLTLKSVDGKTVETKDLNRDLAAILPDGLRTFTAQLNTKLDKNKDYKLVLAATTESGEAATSEKVIKSVPNSNTSLPTAAAESNLRKLVTLAAMVVALGGAAALAYIFIKRIDPNDTQSKDSIMDSRLSAVSRPLARLSLDHTPVQSPGNEMQPPANQDKIE